MKTAALILMLALALPCSAGPISYSLGISKYRLTKISPDIPEGSSIRVQSTYPVWVIVAYDGMTAPSNQSDLLQLPCQSRNVLDITLTCPAKPIGVIVLDMRNPKADLAGAILGFFAHQTGQSGERLTAPNIIRVSVIRPR